MATNLMEMDARMYAKYKINLIVITKFLNFQSAATQDHLDYLLNGLKNNTTQIKLQ